MQAGTNNESSSVEVTIIEAFIRGRGLDPGTILREEAQTEGFSEQPDRVLDSRKEKWELRTRTEKFAESLGMFEHGISQAMAQSGRCSRWREPIS